MKSSENNTTITITVRNGSTYKITANSTEQALAKAKTLLLDVKSHSAESETPPAKHNDQ